MKPFPRIARPHNGHFLALEDLFLLMEQVNTKSQAPGRINDGNVNHTPTRKTGVSLTLDLRHTFLYLTPPPMRELIGHAAGICHGTGGRHFARSARPLESHMDGICAHALHPVTSGKVEGANNMIKTLRRKHHGLPDDEYLFLKIMDASRKKQRWQPPLHTPQRTKIRQEPQLLSSTSSKAPITLSGICDWKKSRSLRCSRSSVRSPGIAATP